MSLLRGVPRWTSIVGLLMALLSPHVAAAAPVQVFVEDLKVELRGWSPTDAEALGKALAADLQGAIVKNPAFRPMTYENLESQLRKEKRAEQLSCSKTDQACIQKILDNYGCEERLYGTVRQVGEQAQVSLTRYRNEQLVEGGAASAYAKATASDVAAAATRLARELFRSGSNLAPSSGPEGALGAPSSDWSPELQAKVVVGFESEPAGALVEVDGDVLCEAPCSKSLAKGPHRVTLKKARYRTWEGDLDAQRATTLRQSLSPVFGWLTVTSDPSGLVVSLDGKAFGTTGALERTEQDPGLYEVRLADDRYEPAGERVQVEAGEARHVVLAPKPKEGALQVDVVDDKGNAVEATVWLDGVKAGASPWAGKVMIGRHEVKVQAADGRSTTKQVDIAYRQVTSESFDMGSLSVAVDRVVGAMATVPAGEFWMGCNPEVDNECRDDETPRRNVSLDEYRVDVHEVTIAEYAACVAAGTCSAPDSGRACNWGQAGRDQHPVNCVDWSQARGYCEWAGKRLPTEAEWEKAARGTDGRKFPWGNQGVSCALAVWSDGNKPDGCGDESTWPVCSKSAGNSPYGLCDMAGNVWEWVQDSYADYDPGNVVNPGRSEGSDRVIRGGSWFHVTADWLRASTRGRFAPTVRGNNLGFRCADGAPRD